MHPNQPFAEESSPTASLRRAINALLGLGRDMLGRVQAALTHATIAHLPKRLAKNPTAAAQRLTTTLDWIHALVRTLAGDPFWHLQPTYVFPRFPGRYPALTAQLRAECGLPPIPPATPAQKHAAHLRYMRKVFATQPTAKIAKRLARRLGVKEGSDYWPTELLAITLTPVAWAKQQARPRQAPSFSEEKEAKRLSPLESPPPAPNSS